MERDPGENVAKADSKVLSSEKVDGIKTLSQPWWPTPGQGRQPKAAQNSGSEIGRKVWKKNCSFSRKLASSPRLIKPSEEV